MKRKLSMLLVVLLMSSVLPSNWLAMTVHAATSGAYTYTVSDGEATITDCDTSVSGTLYIPSSLEGYPVTSIGKYAFSYSRYLTEIEIPESVTSIGKYAFYGCYSLREIRMAEGVTRIEDYAFSQCDLLEEINIPASITHIGIGAFTGCTSLTKVDITDLARWCDIDFVDITSVPSSSAGGLYLNGNRILALEIPEGVTEISSYAFAWCDSITSVLIPTTVTKIGIKAFCGCSELKRIILSNSVKTISESAFLHCYRLQYVYYMGTYADRKSMVCAYDNDYLKDAIWNYTSCLGTDIHSYYDGSSTVCTTCGNNARNLITYDYNIGDGTIYYQTKNKGTSITLKDCSIFPKRKGYVFRGWSTYKIGEVKYVANSTYIPNKDIILYALWSKSCSGCDGEGELHSQIECSKCDGYGKISTSDGRRICTSCGGNVVQNVTGYWGSYYACERCGGSSYTTSSSTSTCSDCSGTGKKQSSKTCVTCEGKGVHKDASEKPDAPTVAKITNTSIVLESDGTYEFSMNGVDWQADSLFDKLMPGTEYTIYRRVAEGEYVYASEKSEALIVSTRVYTPGDVDGSEGVTDADALYLLYHTIFGDSYPIEQDCDYNHDGSVTDADALYLLYHTIFGDSYPLN